MLLSQKHSTIVKQIARDLGFDFCGISKANFLEDEAPKLESWLNENRHGEMHYMANHFDKRLDPRKLVDGAKSVVSLLYNYYPSEEASGDLKISKYAYGEDYHQVIKAKMQGFMNLLQEQIGEVMGRVFVDSAPVLDKVWATKSGIGWQGKNTNLINPKQGSFFFISELILDIELEADGPIKDYCGTCTRCLDACPTDALFEPYKIDATKCISYLTIELKEEIPSEFSEQMNDWVFGCDICQDVCPWNRFSKPHSEEKFLLKEGLKKEMGSNFQDLTQEVFSKVFSKSAVKRTKFMGLKRNIDFIKPKI